MNMDKKKTRIRHMHQKEGIIRTIDLIVDGTISLQIVVNLFVIVEPSSIPFVMLSIKLLLLSLHK